jgi:signal transduction histidine kinase
MIEQQVEHLVKLIEQMQEMAQLDHKAASEKSAVKVNEVVQQVESTFQPRFAAKGVHLDLNLSPDTPLALVSERYLEKALEHLLDNALRYTPANGRVSILTELADQTVTVRVRDTGEGINRADLPNIFDHFYKGNKGRTQDGSGAGLGLSMVKRIVELYEGSISVESAIGEGTTFTIHLPLAKAAENRANGIKNAPPDAERR